MSTFPFSPYSTPQSQGCGGELKLRPEDFVVEELPLYELTGEGEHLYLFVEKKGISTSSAVARLCQELGIHPDRAGHAGLKDSQSVSRQWLSFHVSEDPPLSGFEVPGLKVLTRGRHPNKLRLGHHRGNRFEITIRAAVPPAGFSNLLDQLSTQGFPNYFGTQRLGVNAANITEGRRLLKGVSRGPKRHSDWRYLVNAYQSHLFNRVVARRIQELGNLHHLLTGDLAMPSGSRGTFVVSQQELEASQARAATGALSATAPLFGFKSPLAEGMPGEWEKGVLTEEGVTQELFRGARKRFSFAGLRRPVRAFPEALRWEHLPEKATSAIRVGFVLPPGVFATSLLREMMKKEDVLDLTHFPTPAESTCHAP